MRLDDLTLYVDHMHNLHWLGFASCNFMPWSFQWHRAANDG